MDLKTKNTIETVADSESVLVSSVFIRARSAVGIFTKPAIEAVRRRSQQPSYMRRGRRRSE
jgi:hypothetical protein